MGLDHLQNQEMGLALSSTDAKPRRKWTPDLHHQFVEAVNELGGPDKATPKCLMRMMGIPGLTLYHLKSHLQKYRHEKHQKSEICNASKEEAADYKGDLNNVPATQDKTEENSRSSHAIQMQMEVQRKLHEQIEIQRHLQLRIEAQGNYLQKVLKRAQETLCSCSSAEVSVSEAAKSELSGLSSDLTETPDSSLHKKHRLRSLGCSPESSLTSSDSSRHVANVKFSQNHAPCMSSLLDHQLETRVPEVRKRSRSAASDDCFEQGSRKKRSETFDLNSKCDQNHYDLE